METEYSVVSRDTTYLHGLFGSYSCIKRCIQDTVIKPTKTREFTRP